MPSQEQSKLTPKAVEVEQSILGAILSAPDNYELLSSILKPELFYDEANRIIYEAIDDLKRDNDPIDLISVTQALRKKGNLEQAGGALYITQITTKVTSISNVMYHAHIVYEQFWKRELIKMGQTLIDEAYSETSDPFKITRDISEDLFALQSNSEDMSRKPMLIQESLEQFADNIAAIKQGSDEISGLSTGFENLDIACDGLRPNNLIILAARPGMGKTAFALNIVQSLIDQNTSGIFFSLEMSKDQLLERVVSAETTINSTNIRHNQLSPEDWNIIEHYMHKVSNSKVAIQDNANRTIDDVITDVKQHKLKYGKIDWVMVDYLQLLNYEVRKNQNKSDVIGDFSRKLKMLAGELNIPIIALSQLNRAVEARQNKRPQTSDLRDSGNIEQDADIIMFLYRPVIYSTSTYSDDIMQHVMGRELHDDEYRRYAELSITKNRGGDAGMIQPFFFFGEISRFQRITHGLVKTRKEEYLETD